MAKPTLSMKPTGWFQVAWSDEIGLGAVHRMKYFDREMIGQGSANVVSGALSGLPVTGVIVRSSTNVNAGARTRWSAVLHGVWILLFASMLTDLVELVPKAALAGLLIVIGMQLVKLAQIRMARRTGDLAVYLITVVCVVFLNLLEGVAIGLAVSIVILLWRVMRAHMEARPAEFGNDADDNEDWHVELDGTLSFLSLPRLVLALAFVAALGPGINNAIIAIAVLAAAERGGLQLGSGLVIDGHRRSPADRTVGIHPEIGPVTVSARSAAIIVGTREGGRHLLEDVRRARERRRARPRATAKP